ncbi:MAG: hypothetical protein ACFFCW_00055 [Candidatus Hodarchaeota archaeon]
MSYESRMKEQNNNLRTIYQELCTSYRAIDDFRAKLLGFLPLATGSGIFLLLTYKTKIDFVEQLLLPIGVFGFVVTLGLFCFELHGIKKCTHLINVGSQLEKTLGIENGQFGERPRGVAGFINEPFAAGVIYPAVLAAWTFLALDFKTNQDPFCFELNQLVDLWAIRVFSIGFVFSFLYDLRLILDEKVGWVVDRVKTEFARLARLFWP